MPFREKGEPMNSNVVKSDVVMPRHQLSMQQFGDVFIEALPRHISALKIPGRVIMGGQRKAAVPAHVDYVSAMQLAMYEVLCHDVTQQAQRWAEKSFNAFLEKERVDEGVLKFFNGWHEMHKTTSLVSAKIIMRLAADAGAIPVPRQPLYNNVMAHMHEVAKDDFGLGHEGHDGMYEYMTTAFGASRWVEKQYAVKACNEFSEFLYSVGVAENKSPLRSHEHKQSILAAMMTSVASELWNGREYNYIAQYIGEKLQAVNPTLRADLKALRVAKGYVMGHSGEVENRHGLHALAAAQAYCRFADIEFDIGRLKEVMLDYNDRVGNAFRGLHDALMH